MGNSSSPQTAAATDRFVPNVREHHSRALYVNIPIEADAAKKLVVPPLEPDTYGDGDGQCYLSVCVDDLDSLETRLLGRWWPTGLSGWMTKVNLLVRCPATALPGCEAARGYIRGYQILSLHFEGGGMGGAVKVKGAVATQRIPSCTARYLMTSGKTGKSMRSSMAAGTAYGAQVARRSTGPVGPATGGILLRVQGTLRPLRKVGDAASNGTDTEEFARFVVERPHKFLVWNACNNSAANQARSGAGTGRMLAYSPEEGVGARFGAEGVMRVGGGRQLQHPQEAPSNGKGIEGIIGNRKESSAEGKQGETACLVEVENLVRGLLQGQGIDMGKAAGAGAGAGAGRAVHFDKATCLLQPDYVLVDHKNQVLASEH